MTGNAGKLREVKAILLQGTPIEITSQALDSGCPPFLPQCNGNVCPEVALPVPELQGSTQEVAREKCRRAADLVRIFRLHKVQMIDIFQIGGPCITEDTALCFKALNGLPGPYIKYFLTELGHDGDINLSRDSHPCILSDISARLE